MASDLEAARITSLPQDAFYIADFITEEEENWLLQKVASAPLPRWTQLSHRRLQTWPAALSKNDTLVASPLPGWLVSPIIEPRLTSLGIFADAPHGAPNHVLVNEYRPGQGIMPHEDGEAYFPLVATVSLGAGIVLDLYPKYHEQIHDQTHGPKEDDQGEDSPGKRVDIKEGEYEKQDIAAAAAKEKTTSEIRGSRQKPQFRILQERRSLLITRGSIYTEFLHGIAETTRDEDMCPETICNWHLLRETDSYRPGSYQRATRISLTYRDVLKVAKMGHALKFLKGR